MGHRACSEEVVDGVMDASSVLSWVVLRLLSCLICLPNLESEKYFFTKILIS